MCLFGDYDLSRVCVIVWGVDNEEMVIRVFIVLIGLVFVQIGVWLYEFGVLGVFLDGLVGDDVVFECKCLYIY